MPKKRVEALAAGDWLETGANLIAIGNSGAGKTHLLCAIGHALIEAGHRVLYTRTTDLVQRLQAARRDLALEAALAKLDKFDLIILDDIAYAQKDQAETSVLFELIARRYETRSLAIAANQRSRAWDRVFPDPAVTVAAVDRLVHHATILEMNVDSYRRRAAATRHRPEAVDPPTTPRRQPRRSPLSRTHHDRSSQQTGHQACRHRPRRLTPYKGWSGVLQADAYAGFGGLYAADRPPRPITEALCWAHARRKFYELADIAAGARRGPRAPPISPLALEAVRRIDELFDLERATNGADAAARLAARRETAAPLVADLERWMRGPSALACRVTPPSPRRWTPC